jgi:hypothetical protein
MKLSCPKVEPKLIKPSPGTRVYSPTATSSRHLSGSGKHPGHQNRTQPGSLCTMLKLQLNHGYQIILFSFKLIRSC